MTALGKLTAVETAESAAVDRFQAKAFRRFLNDPKAMLLAGLPADDPLRAKIEAEL